MRPQDHGTPLWPTRDGCLSPLHHTLNHLFCGAWLPGLDCDPAAPPTRLKSCFVRIGNSCSEEARVLELLKSHKDAWIDWLAAMKVALLLHYARLDGAERATPCRPLIFRALVSLALRIIGLGYSTVRTVDCTYSSNLRLRPSRSLNHFR